MEILSFHLTSNKCLLVIGMCWCCCCRCCVYFLALLFLLSWQKGWFFCFFHIFFINFFQLLVHKQKYTHRFKRMIKKIHFFYWTDIKFFLWMEQKNAIVALMTTNLSFLSLNMWKYGASCKTFFFLQTWKIEQRNYSHTKKQGTYASFEIKHTFEWSKFDISFFYSFNLIKLSWMYVV